MTGTSKVLGSATALASLATAALVGLQPASAASSASDHAKPSRAYVQANLVSNIPGLAAHTDSNLKNPWGMSTAPGLPIWISDNNAGVTTLYDGAGNPIALQPKAPQNAVVIPPPASAAGGAGTPTGTVFNANGKGFVVSENGVSGSSRFLFATEDGTIVGWSPQVDRAKGIIAVDRSTVTDPAGDSGAVYKVLAIVSNAAGSFLYATNFRFGTVDVFYSNLSKRLRIPISPRALHPSGSTPSTEISTSPLQSRSPTSTMTLPERAMASSMSSTPTAACSSD